jgi:hypothetical protein
MTPPSRSDSAQVVRTRRPIRDLTGQRFGHLVAVRPTDRKRGHGHNVIWECLCDCGATHYVAGSNLGRNVRSCGCERHEEQRKKVTKHGASPSPSRGLPATPEYQSWRSMKSCLTSFTI